MLSANEPSAEFGYDERDWPRLMVPGYRYEAGQMYLDGCSNVGKALALVGALATAGLAGVQAGIDLGMDLVAEQMRQDAMRQSMKGQSNILVPSRQMILPGIK
jgi:hypothetical protein